MIFLDVLWLECERYRHRNPEPPNLDSNTYWIKFILCHCAIHLFTVSISICKLQSFYYGIRKFRAEYSVRRIQLHCKGKSSVAIN